MVRIIIVSAHEWRNDMQIHVASLHLKQAFDRVTPTPAMALLREQVEGRNIVSFGWITVDEVGLDKSIKQGWRESLTFVQHGGAPLAETSECATKGATTRRQDTNGHTRRERRTADIADDILTSSRKVLLGMAQSATEKNIQCELECETHEMQSACCCSALDERGFQFTMNSVKCRKCW